ncbi:PAAR domain-containing protein [Enterobacter hormaechei]|uniref:PAAR domain-containing protein n=1 Tax=Enterobacter hormaechei TaxID=158836 RepID=UPI002A2BCED9|nr:PAAR domain-containing protein [Enterobacter hormaechei]EKS6405761.1 PAAR domain-containing protein [Enterobacter hormaechei]
MSKCFVILGDKTTHNSKVISVSSMMVINGKKVVLIGDKAHCHTACRILYGVIKYEPDRYPFKYYRHYPKSLSA